MRKTRLKLAVASLLLVMALACGIGLIAGASWLVAFSQQGSDPATALNITPNVPVDIGVKVQWEPDASDTGRALDRQARQELEQAYQRAWLEWNLAYARNDPRGLGTAFSGPALATLSEAIQSAAAARVRVIQVDVSHRLQLTFYSADGALAALRDQQSLEIRLVRDASGQLVHISETESTYQLVFVQEDGRWRIRHLTRVAANTRDMDTPLPPRSPLPGMIDTAGTALIHNGTRYQIHGMHYYPQTTPWDRFWPNYASGIIDQDFARMRALGINTIRVFIPYEQFGGMHVQPIMLEHLKDLLDRADLNGLKVIVTLFDFRTDYNPLLWPQADRHLETLLTTFREHPAILAWDLKHEPDRDYATQSRDVVDQWLIHILHQARSYAPHQLLTIGWSSAQAAAAFPAPVDIISFHDSLPPGELALRYGQIRRTHRNQPILLGSYGLSTWNSLTFPNGHGEAEQADYYADVEQTIRASDMVGSVAWMLYDVDYIPTQVAGRWPWQTGPQAHMGVLRANGSLKPAAFLVAPDADLDIPRRPWWMRFLKPSWLFWSGVAVVALWMLLRWRAALKR